MRSLYDYTDNNLSVRQLWAEVLSPFNFFACMGQLFSRDFLAFAEDSCGEAQ